MATSHTRLCRSYTVYAAAAEEAGEGWIWLREPGLLTRTLITVENVDNGWRVCCEARILDQNFVDLYNGKHKNQPQPIALADLEDAVFMSEWYRNALGGFMTTKRSGNKVRLRISRASTPWLRDLRAACHYPNIVVRLGARLGILGRRQSLPSGLPK